MSQRLQACCCESNPCQGPSGSCCMPDGTCVDVSCAYDCSQRGGIFRPNVQCSGNPCVPPTQKCNCDDATWRKSFLGIHVTRLYIRTNIEEVDPSQQGTGLWYKRSDTYFFTVTHYLTQAQIDAGLLPTTQADNPTGYPLGTDSNSAGNVTYTSVVTVQEYRDTQECCDAVNVTRTVSGPDYYYFDEQGGNYGPFPTDTTFIVTDTPYYDPFTNRLCYDCCCQRIPTACAQVGIC